MSETWTRETFISGKNLPGGARAEGDGVGDAGGARERRGGGPFR